MILRFHARCSNVCWQIKFASFRLIVERTLNEWFSNFCEASSVQIISLSGSFSVIKSFNHNQNAVNSTNARLTKKQCKTTPPKRTFHSQSLIMWRTSFRQICSRLRPSRGRKKKRVLQQNRRCLVSLHIVFVNGAPHGIKRNAAKSKCKFKLMKLKNANTAKFSMCFFSHSFFGKLLRCCYLCGSIFVCCNFHQSINHLLTCLFNGFAERSELDGENGMTSSHICHAIRSESHRLFL